jgi:PAS domain-containing protein
MTRYYEALRLPNQPRKQTDFIHRKRHGGIVRTVVTYIVASLLIVTLYAMKNSLGGDGIFLTVILVILGVLTLTSTITMQRHLDLVTSIEFQNALFSSAFREGKLFSMIVSQDDQMYYADPSFYKLFPELAKSGSQVLDAIVQDSAAPQANLDKLNKALITKEPDVFDVFVSKEGNRVKARMSVTPLARPAGYFFVSARLFAEVRDGVQNVKAAQGEEAQMILDALCEQVSDMAYVLDGDGEIICCTHAFADFIGAKHTGDMVGRAFVDLLAHASAEEKERYTIEEDPSHPIAFRTRGGETKRVMVSHAHIHNGHDAVAFTLGKILA